jgi:adenylate kinase
MRHAVRSELESMDMQRGGWILEGFPRDTAQLIALMTWTAALPTFVYLQAEPWGIIERLLGRQRADDTPDAIARRFADFEAKTQPVLEILEGGGVLHTIPDVDQLAATVVVQKVRKLLT